MALLQKRPIAKETYFLRMQLKMGLPDSQLHSQVAFYEAQLLHPKLAFPDCKFLGLVCKRAL